jgi:molybdenum ABC transporter molybdate-binding protein
LCGEYNHKLFICLRLSLEHEEMKARRTGQVNSFLLTLGCAVALLVVLGFVLYRLNDPGRRIASEDPVTGTTDHSTDGKADKTDSSAEDKSSAKGKSSTGTLLLYCAAGIRLPVEQIAAEYEQEYGVGVHIQYGGSNTLLSQIGVAKTGDLYLAADDSYTKLAQEKGLVKETIPIATMRLVIAVKKGNPKKIQGVADLLRDDVITALGNPDQAAIGKTVRTLLAESGHWERLEKHVTNTGVFKPTVPEVANDVKLGSADAGIVWDTTLALYPELEAVRVAELNEGTGYVAVGILADSTQPTEALQFARYLTARDRGLPTFEKHGFETVEGDVWAEVPQITFFCGSVNRRAVDELIRQFEHREGAVVNTVYNGCGILTAQMKTIRGQQQGAGFPDTYMACDRYYLENVQDWFQEDVDISDTEVVIAVPKGNPARIANLQDLTKEGIRISVGQPEQCTIGVLTRNVLKAEGVYDEVMKNVVMQTPTSAMLIPTVTTNSLDATLAYMTDTKAEADKVDAIRITSPAAKAVQPFAIARSSEHKQLGRRLYQTIAESRSQFESAGFHFRLK